MFSAKHLVYVLFQSLLVFFLVACSSEQTAKLEKLSPTAIILAYGDSLTYGTGAKQQESYPAILEQITGRKVINAGVPGELSIKGLQRLPSILEEHKPDLMILCHAGNDLLQKANLDAAANNIREMIRLSQEQNIPVILLGVPKPGMLLSTADFYSSIVEEFALPHDLKSLAEIISDAKLKSDPVHPNAAGYRKLAENISQLLMNTGAL